MERCTFCGSELPRAAQFCGHCGRIVISLRELPTNVLGCSTVDMFEDDTPTSISSPSRTLLSGVERGDRAILHTRPEAGELTGMSCSRQENDEEDCILFGLPLAGAPASAGDTLLAQGTPQSGSIPRVQGTSDVAFAGLATQGAAAFATTPFPVMPAPERNTPPLHVASPQTPLPQTGSWSPTHPTVPSPHLSLQAKQTGSRSGASRAGSYALPALLVAVICLILIGTIGGLFFGTMPALALVGGSSVTAREALHLHGSRFFPGSSITFTLDDRLQIFAAARSDRVSESHNSRRSATPASLLIEAADQLAASNTGTKASGDGSFDVTIPVSPLWGLGPHTIRATESFASRSILVNFTVVAAAAKMEVEPSMLDFGKVEAGSKAVLTLMIHNAGGQPLQWQATTGGVAWLKLAPAAGLLQAGTSPQIIYVTGDSGRLKAGSYSAVLTIRSNGGSVYVRTSLEVKPQACRLQAPSTSNETFSVKMGTNPSAQTFTTGVSGSCAGGVTITPNVTMAAGTGWLAVSPSWATITSGSVPFTVHVTSSSLTPGTYSGSISLAAVIGNNAIKNGLQTVGVTLSVTEVPPVLAVSPTALSYRLTNGDSPTANALTIFNTGGAPLNWTAALDAKAPSFVSLSASSGTGLAAGASTGIKINVDPSGQQAGTYAATVTVRAIDPITGQSVGGSPATVSVAITITALPSMQVSPTSLTFTPDNCVYTASSPVTITNAGGGTLTWSTGEPVYASNAPTGWLTVSPTSGSDTAGASSTLTFSVDGAASQLVSGQTYTAVVTITPSVGDSQVVSVSFTMPSCV